MSLRYGGTDTVSETRDTSVSGERSSGASLATGSPEGSDRVRNLISESQALQTEINNLFNELSAVNREIRIDVDDFCDMCDSSLANISATPNN